MSKTGSLRDYMADVARGMNSESSKNSNDSVFVVKVIASKDDGYTVDKSNAEVIEALVENKLVIYRIFLELEDSPEFLLTNIHIIGTDVCCSYSNVEGTTIEFKHDDNGFDQVQLG